MTANKIKGHWPRGKRRNAQRDTAIVLAKLRRRVYPRGKTPQKQAAREIGVSDRTIRRWLDGTDYPSRDSMRVLRVWIDNQ